MSTAALPVRERRSRQAGDAVARARLAVVPRRRVRAARMPFVTLVSLVLLGGIVGLLCFNTQMQQASFAATALEGEADALSARQQTLHDQLQDLRSPQHLATVAQQAGMVAPQSSCTLRLADQTTDEGCAPATVLSTPTLLARPPHKPAVLDPKPVVVVVPAPAGTTTATATGGATRGEGHRNRRAGRTR